MISAKPQAYAVVSNQHDTTSSQHVVIHGEVITPLFDKRKRELCFSFTGGITVGLLLFAIIGSLAQSHRASPPPLPQSHDQLPTVNVTTPVHPLIPPSGGDHETLSKLPPSQDEVPEDKPSSWWSQTSDTVSGWFGGGKDETHETKTAGGGRDWLVNAQTGIVASKMDPSYLLGVGPAPLVLVRKDSEAQLLFLQSPNEALEDVDLVAKGNEFIGFINENGSQVEGFEYFDTVTSPSVEPLTVTYQDDNFLVFADDYVLDVVYWQIIENQKVNFVKALDGSTFKAGGGRDWIWNKNGSVSPKLNLNLVLGMGPRGLVITQKEEQALLLAHAQELANGETVPMEGSGILMVGASETKTADGWRYRETLLVENAPIRIQYDGNFILTPDQDFCLDIAYWELQEGNVVNFVGGD
mmetsp:Transcript_31966/g.52772  ORF Transcript_31966/g.52772 Transcript_31966/m.52772 type:complete len:411 (-) Transcript_31966:21-1253(-)